MKYPVIIFLCLFACARATAQQPTVRQLRETAATMLQQGDFANAVVALEKAAQQEPKDLELLKELSFAYYLKRDFAKAIEVAKPLVERPDADQQAFQILGMNYKAIAQYKECARLYKNALKRFSNSGVIYNEYGELLDMDNSPGDAVVQWEKGIAADPSYSGNYYNAAKYYNKKGQWVRVLLYGEIFLNLESYSGRVNDVKRALLVAYQNLYSANAIQDAITSKASSAFEKTILEALAKTATLAKEGITIDNLTTIRTRFILEWFQSKDKQYPYQLFNRLQYLLREGLFEAYNQWLFGDVINADAYKVWQENHQKAAEGFRAFQQSRVFTMPAGQYYMQR